MKRSFWLLMLAAALLTGCMSSGLDSTAYCTPVRIPPPVAASCAIGPAPSGHYAVREQTLYVVDWDRRNEVIAALKGELIAPTVVLLHIDHKKIKIRLARKGRSGPTETKDGFLLPEKEKQIWDEKLQPQYGDVLIWLDRECEVASFPLDCTKADYEVGGQKKTGWLKWANGQKEKSYGGCGVEKKAHACTSVWTDTGDIDAYGDEGCKQKVETIPYGLWVCMTL